MSKKTTTPRAWSDIEGDFIRISGPIIAATDLLAEATHENGATLNLRDGTIYNISEQCCVGLLEIKDLFYELADLYVNAKGGES